MGALEAGFALVALNTCVLAAGFELSTRSLGIRSRPSRSVILAAPTPHFVSENDHPRPVWSLHITAFGAQYGNKMATTMAAAGGALTP
jgi:hypothetical protein